MGGRYITLASGLILLGYTLTADVVKAEDKIPAGVICEKGVCKLAPTTTLEDETLKENNNPIRTEREDLCPRVIQLEEKYKDGFFNEEGHKFYMSSCTKETVIELTMLVEMQQKLSYPVSEIAKTFTKLCHAVYGNGIRYQNVDSSLKHAKEIAQEVLRFDKNSNDYIVLGLAGQQEQHKNCEGGLCGSTSIKELSIEEMKSITGR